jgi:hypothetical protein
MNLGAWGWAVVGFGGRPALLGIAMMVYGLGLRHAVDADHIAAIDNVTRKLMQSGKRPVAVGFFFALGHSAVVTAVAAAVAGAAQRSVASRPFRTSVRWSAPGSRPRSCSPWRPSTSRSSCRSGERIGACAPAAPTLPTT